MHIPISHHSLLLDVARGAIRAALTDAPDGPVPSDAVVDQPAGCFVSLHARRSHRLRGCVGRLDASLALGQTVRKMARTVLEDPRFKEDPVTPAEFADLEIELSIISPLTPAESPEDFDLQSEGIYLTCQGRTGCFLPQVARETGWHRVQLLERLCTEKLGLPASAWRSNEARLEKFTVTLIGPASFE